jgi:7-cyano-7-deazaguanine reductase
MNSEQPSVDGYTPKHLGLKSSDAVDTIDRIPWKGGEVTVTLVCSEFTSLCPVTEQPDFGEITVRYRPGRYLVETKSLKLYMMRYRDRGVFNEVLIDEMADDLQAQLEPTWLEVEGRFNSRGGITISVVAARAANGNKGA